MIRNLINISGTSVTLSDLNGLVIEVGGTANGLAFEEAMLINSVSVAQALLAGTIKLNDGVVDYTKMDAVNFLKGLTTQFTRDGKPITTVSDRPKDYYRHFTGSGDDITSSPKKIGEGPAIHLIAEPGTTTVLDVAFMDDVYIRDGEIQYLNAGFDSHLSIEVFCPPNIPFPHPTKQGTLDLTSSGFVPNLTNTGSFMTAPVEVRLFRFINKMHLVGNGPNAISSPEPFMLNTPYFLRVSVSADAEIVGPMKAAVTIGMFRKKTF